MSFVSQYYILQHDVDRLGYLFMNLFNFKIFQFIEFFITIYILNNINCHLDRRKMKITVHNIQKKDIYKVAEHFENLVCINVINKSASSFKARKIVNEG